MLNARESPACVFEKGARPKGFAPFSLPIRCTKYLPSGMVVCYYLPNTKTKNHYRLTHRWHMILVPGHNPAGNVLHIIVGPESDLYADLHGAQVCDISEILRMFGADEPVFLSITRTKSEQTTVAGLAAAGVPVALAGKPTTVGPAVNAASSQQQQQQQQPRTGTCLYCGQEQPLVSEAATRICAPCLEIELGLKRSAKARTHEKL